MQLTYMIDDYRWQRTMPAAEARMDAKSWAEALPPWWCRPRTTPIYELCGDMNHTEIWTTPRSEPRVRYWMARWMADEFGSADKEELRSGTRERRRWVNRVSELRTRGKVINWAFLSSVSSLLLSSPYFITSLDLGPVQMASARVFTTSGSQPSGGGVSPCAGSAERLPWVVPISSGTYDLVQVRTRYDCLIFASLSFPFLSFLLYGVFSPGGLRLKRGIM